MQPLRSKLNPQGRTTIPAEIRRDLGIGPGTVLEWEVDGARAIVRKSGKYSFDDIHRALFPTPAETSDSRRIEGRHR